MRRPISLFLDQFFAIQFALRFLGFVTFFVLGSDDTILSTVRRHRAGTQLGHLAGSIQRHAVQCGGRLRKRTTVHLKRKQANHSLDAQQSKGREIVLAQNEFVSENREKSFFSIT